MNYSAKRTRAAEMIQANGKVVTIRHYPAVASGYTYSYDPVLGDTWTLIAAPFTVTHTKPASLFSDYTTYALELKYELRDIDGTAILSGDRRFMVSALDTTGAEIPLSSMKDRFIIGLGTLPLDGTWTLDGTEYLDGQKDSVTTLKVVNVIPFQPGDTVIYYELQARI